MQYNKQLFTGDLLDLQLHLSTHLIRKFAYTSSFLPLGYVSYSSISFAIKPKTIDLQQRVPYLGIRF